jgi:hypothetical protein
MYACKLLQAINHFTIRIGRNTSNVFFAEKPMSSYPQGTDEYYCVTNKTNELWTKTIAHANNLVLSANNKVDEENSHGRTIKLE